MERMLSKIKKKKYAQNVPDKVLKDAIRTYDNLFDFLVEINHITELQNRARWDFIDIDNIPVSDDFAFDAIYHYLVILGKRNLLSYVDPIIVSIMMNGKNRIWEIKHYLCKLIGFSNPDFSDKPNFNPEGYFYSLCYDIMPGIFTKSIRNKILIANSVSKEDKVILRAYERLCASYKPLFSKEKCFCLDFKKQKSLEFFLSFSYAYFRMNNMTVSNYGDIMMFISKIKKDLWYLYAKLEHSGISRNDEYLEFFKMYYNELLTGRKEIR